MKTMLSNRRLNVEQFRDLDHAIDLVRTHGRRYAVVYLRNHCIAESTLQRVLFGDWERRRASANELAVLQWKLAGSC
jgi:Mn-dependent DtxR family transcriptional regulator